MDFVEQVKSSVDLVKVVSDHGIRLRKLGATSSYTGLCPFHQEKTPSFRVHGTHQYYKCFGCDAKGDVFKFVMEIERISFFEALKLLADQHGIPMPKRAEFSDPDSKLRAAIYEMHEIALQLFRSNLMGPAGADARGYLAKRGVSPDQAEAFGLGLSADSWDQLSKRLQQDRIDPDVLDKSGLVTKRQEGGGFYDRFRARLMFPIHNEAGKIIGFGGRALKAGDEPKYLNSPETVIYRKSYVLYNLHRAKDAIRKREQSILVEGYMDAIGVFSAGVHEAVASCGTALTNTQVRLLKKYSEQIVVNFDPDTAGANATQKSIQMLLEEGMRVRVLELEGGLDPDEYIKQNGAEAYERKLKHAGGYFHWLADRARKKFDMSSAEGRIAGLKFLLPAIQRVSDKLERATIAEEVASYLGVERGLVLDEFRKSATGKTGGPQRPSAPAVPAVERLLLNSLLVSEEAREKVLSRVLQLDVFQKLKIKPIIELLHSLASDSSYSFPVLEARLNDRERDLLSSVVFADELSEESKAVDQALECLRTLETQEREMKCAALRERIKAAERSGDVSQAIELLHKLNAIDLKRMR
jgi:DNA primase